MADTSMQVQKFRVAALPEVADRVLGAEYWVRNAETGEIVIYAIGKDSAEVVSQTLSATQVASMISAATSDTSLSWENLLTLTADAASDVSLEVSFKGDEGTVEFNSKLKKILSFGEGVTNKTYRKVTVDETGRVISGTEENDLTAADVGAVATTDVGVTVAPLVAGVVPAANLPSFVDDVVEVSSYNELPGQPGAAPETGAPEKGKIYLVVENTGTEELPTYTTTVYRWGGSVYVQIIDGVSMADQATRLADARQISITGDATWSVNFDGSGDVTAVLTLADTAVVAGDYGFFSVDTKGRLTAARKLILDDIPEGLDHTKVVSAGSIAVVNPQW